jgi:CBS domain-containing protein
MPITKFCVRDVVCSSRDTSIVDAAALMRHRHVGNVIVVDQIGDKRVPIGTARGAIGGALRVGRP